MKRILTTGIAALAFAAVASAMTLAEAGAKLAEAAENPDTMASVMKELSAGDQVKFLKSVNGAIDAMPVSTEEKTAKFVEANKAALKNAAEGNLRALLAETFATASLESLAVMNEQFAKELFNPKADASHPMPEYWMVTNAVFAVNSVIDRTAGGDVSNADQRNALAALMFINAADGDSNLRQTLTDSLGNPEAGEWIAAALGDGEPKTYEPLIGDSAAGGDSATPGSIFVQTPADGTAAFLGDLAGTVDSSGKTANSMTDVTMDPTQYALPDSGGVHSTVPRTLNKDNKYYNGYRRGESVEESGDEPVPYPYQ